MDVLAYRGGQRHGLDDPRREIGWVRAREPNTSEPVEPSQGPEQGGEVILPGMIAVDGLTQECHFGDAALDQAGHLANDLRELPAALRPSRGRNDAEDPAV